MAGWIRVILSVAGLKTGLGLAAGLMHPFAPQSADALFGAWVYLAVCLAFTSVGVMLVWTGGLDPRAVHLGAVFILVATMFSERFLEPLASSHGIVAGLFTFLFIVDPVAFRPYLVWRFAADFPRPVGFGWPRRMATAVLRATAAAGWVFFAVSVLAAVASLRGSSLASTWLAPMDRQASGSLYWLFLTPFTLAALVQIAVNTRSATVLERRRTRVFVLGLLLGTGPILLEALAELLVPRFAAYMNQPDVRASAGLVVYPLLIATPIATAYAVLVDQVLSLRLAVRSAIRYSLARATIIVLCVVPFVLLWFAWTTRLGGGQTLVNRSHILASGGLLAIGLVLLRGRQRLLVAVDRQFFREQYDSREILGGLIGQCRSVHTVSELALQLTHEINRALHVDTAVLMVTDAASDQLIAVGSLVEPLPGDASLATLLRGASEPMDVNLEQPRSMLARLPHGERQWLADGGFQLLVPLLQADAALVGLIAIGRKKSELPFSREDRWLLSAIASSSALALENLHLRASDELVNTPGEYDGELPRFGAVHAPARECESCGSVAPQHTTLCPVCGAGLTDSAVPAILRGTYRIDRLLGRGGMGVVYRATDMSLGRTVAIKTLPSVSPERALQLRREAQAMAAVAHPKLATIYAIELWRGTPLLVVECFERTLQDRLRNGPLPLSEAVGVGIDLAEGLEALHSAGILHRDVKPSNIGFTAGGTPKLLDFGLAKVVRHSRATDSQLAPSESTMTGEAPERLTDSASYEIVGTPLYLSPETIQLRAPDAGVDLWALALVMYESIAGSHPLRAPTAAETMARILKAQIPDIRQQRQDCPPDIAAFLHRALHGDARRRPGTAREFRMELQEIAEPVLAS